MADPSTELEIEGRKAADYSPTTTGWYQDMLPEQRYVAYLTTWVGVAELMNDGRQEEIDPESMTLLAWAPHDDDAYSAADELISSDRYPGLADLHNRVYGNGMAQDGYQNLDFPQINRQNIEQYNVDMITSMGQAGIRTSGMQTGPFYSPGVFEKAAAWLGNFVGGSMDTVREAMGRDPENNPERTGEDVMGAADPTGGDVFYTASQYGTSPADAGKMDMRIMAGDIGQFAAEGYLLGAGVGATSRLVSKLPSTGVNAAARSAAESVGAGNSPSQAIIQSINKFKSTGHAQTMWNATRGIRWGSAGASTVTLASILANAQFGAVGMEDVTGGLSPETQGQLLETRGQQVPESRPPFRPTGQPDASGTPLDTSTAIGRMGEADRQRFQGVSVAEAWQQQQRDRRREEQ